jgi:uncharacterized phosphosugar-binding protein
VNVAGDVAKQNNIPGTAVIETAGVTIELGFTVTVTGAVVVLQPPGRVTTTV